MRMRAIALWILLWTLAGLVSLGCGGIGIPFITDSLESSVSSDTPNQVQRGPVRATRAPAGLSAEAIPDSQTASAKTAGATAPGPESGGSANPNNKPLPLMYFEDYG